MGLRQIRELSMATPVVEELERIGSAYASLPWRELWQHSIGSAILTRDILAHTDILVDDDTDYIIGLLHNVGKVLLATLWPREFAEITSRDYPDPEAVCAAERALVGWDHAMIGGHYLRRHQLAPEIVLAVRHHSAPALAGEYQRYAAAVQIADLAVRETGICGGFERLSSLPMGAWCQCPGWRVIFAEDDPAADSARVAIQHTLARLPAMLTGLV
jgi:HD-like signal output (HDOD) protein